MDGINISYVVFFFPQAGGGPQTDGACRIHGH